MNPWDPVALQYIEGCDWEPKIWGWEQSDWNDVATAKAAAEWLPMRVTLANGQNIIVRAKA